jgi:hypothetical protein
MQVANLAKITVVTDGQNTTTGNVVVTITAADSVVTSITQVAQQTYEASDPAIAEILAAAESLVAAVKSANGIQ